MPSQLAAQAEALLWAKLGATASAFRARFSCTDVPDLTFPGQKDSHAFFTDIPAMPSELDVAMMLWPLFNVSSAALPITAMLESKERYLSSWMQSSSSSSSSNSNNNNNNDLNGVVSWSCRFFRIVWRAYQEIATSNGVAAACYDTCVTARDGVCDEISGGGGGEGVEEEMKVGVKRCAAHTDATDCGCASPWVLHPRGDNNNVGKRTNLTLWASDYHTGPVGDYKVFFPREVAPRIGGNVHITFLDRSFATYCGLEGTCATPETLPSAAVNRTSTWTDCPNQRAYQERVFSGLKGFAPFKSIDAFVVTHPLCGALTWAPFNKSIIGVEATHWLDGKIQQRYFQ